MADDKADIQALIERWAKSVQGGDMDGILADHSDDVVMFDVPPPNDGAHGIDAYRETWKPFFNVVKDQPGSFVFEIASVDVTAGEDVAFAHALLRCGPRASIEADPDGNHLR